ncbi:uncharacterized protein BCR38DRAFT_114156 [Pseudomassariella vexata]|uniref:Uncharacterized protein n=1 Tax=Pseudomassariella vexata TaxID=1141098 RepID=A0A1Y2DBC5_9PEZI|nr:uncharacterized protein BCR38DRAFT_114156 [Pseudomassariella vexata]ORY56572.1 hypothetical protein BCR38DRAFT_114156 [Pseudomassariella vexata]
MSFALEPTALPSNVLSSLSRYHHRRAGQTISSSNVGLPAMMATRERFGSYGRQSEESCLEAEASNAQWGIYRLRRLGNWYIGSWRLFTRLSRTSMLLELVQSTINQVPKINYAERRNRRRFPTPDSGGRLSTTAGSCQ